LGRVLRARAIGGVLAAGLTLAAAGCGSSGSTAPSAQASAGSASFHGSSQSKFCTLVRKLLSQPPLSPTTDLKTVYQQLDSEVTQILAVTPSVIKADMRTVTGVLKQLSSAMAKVNYDPSKLDQSAVSALTGSDVQAASNRIGAYAQQVCGVVVPTTVNP
jgi:hypothetical protein